MPVRGAEQAGVGRKEMGCLGCVGGCLRCLCMDVRNSKQKMLFGFVRGQDSMSAYLLVCGLYHKQVIFHHILS